MRSKKVSGGYGSEKARQIRESGAGSQYGTPEPMEEDEERRCARCDKVMTHGERDVCNDCKVREP